MKRIAVITTGGDAPGINAAIRAIVLAATKQKVKIFGIKEGFQGMIEGNLVELIPSDIENKIHTGGTFLKSSRSAEFRKLSGRKKAYLQLKKAKLEALVVIGGNGSLAGAAQFASEYDLPVIGIPKTIDNDVAGTDYTIGFDTALNNAVSAIDKIRESAASHNRVFFVEVMGRDAGHIALHTGIATGSEVIFIPETVSNIEKLKVAIREHSGTRRSPMIIIVAEGDDAGHALDIIKKISKEFPDLNPGLSVLGYIQRGGAPSIFDRYLATGMGAFALSRILKSPRSGYVCYRKGKLEFAAFSSLKKGNHPIDKELLKLARAMGQIV